MAGRLRFAELLAAVAAGVLVITLLALTWYDDPARHGWAAIPTLRWFVLVTAALGLALALTQATRDGPALAVTLDTLGTVAGALTTALLAIRLLTTGATLAPGAYLGVVAAAATTLGAFRALRVERGWDADPAHPERPVEVVELSSPPSR